MVPFITIQNQYYLFNGNKNFLLCDSFCIKTDYLGQINIHVMMSIRIVHFYFNIPVIHHFEMAREQRRK